MKRLSHIVSRIIYGICFLMLLAVGAFFVLPHIPGVGALDVKIVKSGSMEPKIMTGGIVFIRSVTDYQVGDAITFKSVSADIPTTHRIIDTEVTAGKTFFVTKGDANEERDSGLTSPDAVVGKVLFTIPYVGFILDFARQPLGFGLLIGLPALLIIIDEIEKIWRTLRKRKRDGDEDGGNADAAPDNSREGLERSVYTPLVIPPLSEPRRIVMPDIIPRQPKSVATFREHFAYEARVRSTPRLAQLVFAIVVILSAAQIHTLTGTISYFSDTEASSGNTLKAEALDFTASPDGTTTFTFTDGVLNDRDGAVMTLVAPVLGSSPLRYNVTTEFATGTIALCDAITANVTIPFTYSGPLTSLTAIDVDFDTSWILGLSLTPGAYVSGDICVIDIVYRGWNEKQSPLMGYDDEERVRLTFTVEDTTSPAPFARTFGVTDIPSDIVDNPDSTNTGDGTPSEDVPTVEGESSSTPPLVEETEAPPPDETDVEEPVTEETPPPEPEVIEPEPAEPEQQASPPEEPTPPTE